MISGGISNLIDKIFRGYVIDYINIKTSAFNFADIIIVVGALILIWQILYEKNLTSVKDRKKVIWYWIKNIGFRIQIINH